MNQECSDFAYLDRVQRAAKLLEELGADFDPADEPDDPVWKELSSWGAEAVEALLGAAWSSDHLLVAAVNILGWRGDKTAVLPLAEILTELDERNFEDHLEWMFTAAAIIDALGRIGDVRAIPALNKLLADLLGIAEKDLEKSTPFANVEEFILAVNPQDGNELLYSSLLDAYETLGKVTVVPVLYLLSLPYPYLRDQALDLLQKWETLPSEKILILLTQRGSKRACTLLGK